MTARDLTAKRKTAAEWLLSITPILAAIRAEQLAEDAAEAKERAAMIEIPDWLRSSRRALPRKMFVNPLHDALDGLLMAGFTRALMNARLFGKHYRRGQMERAFRGVDSADVRAVT